MKEIHLAGGKGIALVDDSDYERISQYRWFANGNGYAFAHMPPISKVYMHRFVVDAPKGLDIDHINRNKLDNRRENLRVCDRSHNNANQPKRRHNKTGYKGVTFNKKRGTFDAYIFVSRKHFYLGTFDTPEEAASAYDAALVQNFGEFARTNF